jgi:cytochrome bd ubiquinol oxidase subunit I
MSDVFAARSQMAMSLGFHIIFAVIGMGMPVLMVVAEHRWYHTRDPVFYALAQRWAKGTAILFAVGAVSGTVLSFELGLLWPTFMRLSGSVIGFPFSLEGFAFFTEAIFLGVYLYGWTRVSPRVHRAAGIIVAASGAASALFVVSANAWMNTPTGFRLEGGRVVDVDPVAAMLNPASGPEILHMLVAAYAATGLVVAGVHALLLLRHPDNRFHQRALTVALLVGAPAAAVQPLSGDISARYVARWQPSKLAAMEGQFHSQRSAPLRIGGIPDENRADVRYAIEIPSALSLLAFHDRHAIVQGLDAVPRDQWPPVTIVHIAFDVMVLLGSYMAVVSLWALVLVLRGGALAHHTRLLKAIVAAGPMGFIAIEAGWIVTEVGRQPWIVYGLLRTSDAVTPMPHLVVPFVTFTVLYCLLGVVVALLLTHQVLATAENASPDSGPSIEASETAGAATR